MRKFKEIAKKIKELLEYIVTFYEAFELAKLIVEWLIKHL